MQLIDAIALSKRLISKNEKHEDYQRTVDLASTYKKLITGVGIKDLLHQYTPREDLALFEQRVAITKAITPAVAASLKQPFNKVIRNNRIRKGVTLKNENRAKIVGNMMQEFFGDKRKKNKGLDYWFKTRFANIGFTDPNKWIVIEWDAAANEAEPIKPRPFEVPAQNALNFSVINDETKWLFVSQPIKFTVQKGEEGEEPLKKSGLRYTLYDTDYTIVLEQVSREYLSSITYVTAENEQLIEIKANSYLLKTFEPKVGYVPAFRVGYFQDEVTDGRTFVNPWHNAMCFFEKSLKTVSELDLTMTLHVFPHKLQYVQRCPGETKLKKCNGGIVPGDGSECKMCKGTGYKLQTSSQEALLLPLPTDPKAGDIIDLEKLIAYKNPPIELIKFQNEYTQQLERQAHQAVFNSQVMVRKTANGQQPTETATANENNMQAIYDTLEPFTEKLSELWREFVTLFGILAGEPVESIETVHEFPADPKLKTGDILLSERKNAKDSGAPPFLLQSIDDDLATIVYAGNDLGLKKYQTKQKFFPFTGKTEEEIALLLGSEFVPRSYKILYTNFEQVFRELEFTNPEIYTSTSVVQKELIDKKVEEIDARLKAEAPAPVLLPFRGGQNNENNDEKEQTA